MKRSILCAALLLACLLCLGFYRTQTRTQWEYKVEYHGTISEKKLNELAGQGWELVATASPGDQYQPATFIFRRERAK